MRPPTQQKNSASHPHNTLLVCTRPHYFEDNCASRYSCVGKRKGLYGSGVSYSKFTYVKNVEFSTCVLSGILFISAECIHPEEKKVVYFLPCQTSNTQNASTQNAVQKCKECTKEPILVLFHAGGYALIVDCSKRMINHDESPNHVRSSK
jgi:hypothetical protein